MERVLCGPALKVASFYIDPAALIDYVIAHQIPRLYFFGNDRQICF